jgi:gliding motility-associated-like protein
LQPQGNVTVCQGESIQLDATPGLSSYSWQKDGDNLSFTTSSINVSESGRYTVSIGSTCSAFVNIAMIIPPQPPVIQGERILCHGATGILSVPLGLGTYQWKQNDVEIPEGTSNTLEVNQAGDYSLIINNNTECPVSSDMITVKISAESFIPNVITPGKDDANEYFVINNISPEAELQIYDRWGKLVYRSAPYENNWDGNGIANGVYFYSLRKADQCQAEYKGWIEVIR